MNFKEIWQFIVDNWGTLGASTFALLWVIVRLTPTEKDDRILRFIEKFLNFFIPDRKKPKKGLHSL